MPEIGKRLLSAVILTAIITCLFAAIAEPADAVGLAVTVSLIGGPFEADVQPGASGLVVIPGEVTVSSIGPGVLTVVQLQANALLGSATVSPNTLVFSGGGKQSITVTVKENFGTSSTTPDMVTISGTAQEAVGAPTAVAPATAIINIRQYYRITVSTDTPYVETTPGKPVYFNLVLENNGNGEDTFFMTVEDEALKALSDEGWVVQIGNPKPVVMEKDKRIIQITAQTPQRTTIWKNEIVRIPIEVSSENARQAAGLNIVEQYPVYIRLRGFHIPGFDPTFAIISLALVGAFLMKKRPGIEEMLES